MDKNATTKLNMFQIFKTVGSCSIKGAAASICFLVCNVCEYMWTTVRNSDFCSCPFLKSTPSEQ